jgi:hypothetical protein
VSYIVLRGPWCNIIALNEHAPTEEKSDDSKDSFHEDLNQAFDHFPKYRMKNLLRISGNVFVWTILQFPKSSTFPRTALFFHKTCSCKHCYFLQPLIKRASCIPK